jgi:hypothetical protein
MWAIKLHIIAKYHGCISNYRYNYVHNHSESFRFEDLRNQELKRKNI